MKYSWQRQIILETIQEHKEHLSAQQIYGYARERCPHISLGTVYRNLNTLADNDMIGRVGMISGAECFDWDPNSHEHFYCRKCHKIINLDLPEGELNALIKNVPGLRIEGHCLTVTGVCAECASKEYLCRDKAPLSYPCRINPPNLSSSFPLRSSPFLWGRAFLYPLALFCILFQLRYAGFMRQIFNFMNKNANSPFCFFPLRRKMQALEQSYLYKLKFPCAICRVAICCRACIIRSMK